MINFYNKVAQEHPSQSFVWTLLGKAHIWNGDYDTTIQITENIFSIVDNKHDPDLWLNLGGVYESKCDYVSTLGVYSRGMETCSWVRMLFERLE
jgi:hypothetical protein